ncbi:MAG: Lrp/AsnC family transcriptional regulator, partial [Candidatus Micrarchaeota archaeon]
RSAPKLSKDELSEIDLRMISLLSANSRAPVEELAKKCGISGVTARKKLKQLVAEEAIQRFTMKINYSAFNYQFVKLMFKLQNVPKERRQQFYDYCTSHPNSIYLVEGFGISDVEIDFELRGVKELNAVICDLKERFSDMIMDYEILFFIEEEKLDMMSASALLSA